MKQKRYISIYIVYVNVKSSFDKRSKNSCRTWNHSHQACGLLCAKEGASGPGALGGTIRKNNEKTQKNISQFAHCSPSQVQALMMSSWQNLIDAPASAQPSKCKPYGDRHVKWHLSTPSVLYVPRLLSSDIRSRPILNVLRSLWKGHGRPDHFQRLKALDGPLQLKISQWGICLTLTLGIKALQYAADELRDDPIFVRPIVEKSWWAAASCRLQMHIRKQWYAPIPSLRLSNALERMPEEMKKWLLLYWQA